jgi:hypothetical protein
MDTLGIWQDLVVPKPQNAIAFVLQEATSLDFPWRRAIVLAAVDFNDQPSLVTDKIDDVAPERHLTAEPMSLDLF